MARAVVYSEKFEKAVRNLRDAALRRRLARQLDEIIARPEIGKRLKYDLKGEFSVYVPPFRIVYTFTDDAILFLNFENRDKVYR